MNKKILNKHGSVTCNLSRDIMALDIGDRLPTIIEYTEKFSVSRGIVQNSISLLETEGCISLNRSGKLGTLLTGIDHQKLYRHTLWDPLVGAMPIPHNDIFRSLASAIYEDSRALPLPSSLAYVSGAQNRWSMLSKEFFDYIVTSVATARQILAEDEGVELLFKLPGCQYEDPYCLIFMDNKANEIRDGMRVGVDPDAIDQMQITKALCAGKSIEFVNMPIESTIEILHNRSVDFIIIRNEKWLKTNTDLITYPIPATDYPVDDTTVPAILVNRKNYGIKNLLTKFLSPDIIAAAQVHALSIHSNYKF
ncbi:MAG: YhfZ family protein [Oscillospiraceae bacterium]